MDSLLGLIAVVMVLSFTFGVATGTVVVTAVVLAQRHARREMFEALRLQGKS